ncbi:serine hydrolase domain-containing protein [Dapis sp. BLCC M172]|uniref:serine hydrolase domain-containing protein n=1 Tax=Dapis sp. BLCC M172 TaxID=2975281 RepID=UPI003CF0E67B
MIKKLKIFLLIVIISALVNLGLVVKNQGFTTVDNPELVGLSSVTLNALTEDIQNFVDSRKIAGAVGLIVKDGEIAYRQTFGFSNLENKIPMVENNIFRMASQTKIVTGFATYLLAEDGLIKLTDPVSKYIPSFANMEVLVRGNLGSGNDDTTIPAKNQITIEQLLNHTSGISYNFQNQPILFPLLQAANISDGLSTTSGTIGEMVNRLSKVPLAFEPGTNYLYGLNSDVLGYLIEVVSQKPFNQFLAERIFAPLEMDDTGFFVTKDKLNRLAVTYTPNTNGNLEPIGEKTRELKPGLFIDEAYPYLTGDTYFSGGAGLVSTPNDFARFLQMLLNGGNLKSKDGQQIVKIANQETIEKFLSIRPQDRFKDRPISVGYKYTNGFEVKENYETSTALSSVGSFRGGGLFGTNYFVDPEKEMIGIIMSQVYPSIWELADTFETRAYQAEVIKEKMNK